MKLSLNWLKEYVDIEGISPQELAEKLTLSGTKVGSITNLAEGLEGVVVGELKSIKKHTDADRLSLAEVDVGKRTIQVVFGEKAVVHVGDKVPVAVAPTKLPGGEITVTQFRGERSEGMLCLNSELRKDLADTLTYFPHNTPVGQSVAEALGWQDTLFDFDITPNRGDCFSVLGIGREISALYKLPLKIRKPGINCTVGTARNSIVQIAIDDKSICQKFCALYMKGITVRESPPWLKQRLEAVGMRPISNIVDITNYILLDLGQPLHAFDAAKVQDNYITVRRAREGEEIITLDDKKRRLTAQFPVLADTKHALDVAGVMGGKESEITTGTTDIIVVACVFDPVVIRNAYRTLGLRTEAAVRFEKGVDWFMREEALVRAAQMVHEIAGGETVDGMVKVAEPDPEPLRFNVRFDYIHTLLGKEFEREEIHDILKRLGIGVEGASESFTVTIPSWRRDLTLPADIAEEVGRFMDYNTIPPQPIRATLKPPAPNVVFSYKQRIRTLLQALGYNEVYTYSYYGSKDAAAVWESSGSAVELLNPMSEDSQYLRSSLIPLLLEAASRNMRFFEEVMMYEIGTVFKASSELLPEEELHLAGFISQRDRESYVIYRRLKGDIAVLFSEFGISDGLFEKRGNDIVVTISNKQAGTISILSEKEKEAYKIRRAALVFDFNLHTLVSLSCEHKKYTAIQKFPSIERDLSLVIGQNVLYKNLVQKILGMSHLIQEVRLVDEYYTEAQGRSLTLRITYISLERTLRNEEVDEVERVVVGVLRREFGAELRGGGKK